MSVVRFGVSLEKELLEALDIYTRENRFSNRSQALRNLISHRLTEKKWQCNNTVAGTVTLLFDHHKRDLVQQLTEVQHEHHRLILSSQHFHLDSTRCMEVIAVKGRAAALTAFNDRLNTLKGIEHSRLTMSRIDT